MPASASTIVSSPITDGYDRNEFIAGIQTTVMIEKRMGLLFTLKDTQNRKAKKDPYSQLSGDGSGKSCKNWNFVELDLADTIIVLERKDNRIFFGWKFSFDLLSNFKQSDF
ncbi:MAG: hypothetical protein ABIQ27_11360 [Flavobacterium sp.]|uniref:hypothetical protein n=1 Tax=Flavobacterium sp. TaxID=239 RepID=UPI003263A9F1